ncbi:Siderophore iron transporter mirB 4 [Colletotrichum chlorophyti]|uniref:Siderophore iron transporter mirB 4 n=1 Tax=Colletotrichum chlorophyti TaxID=708187 RepID=A0A1Q8S4D3_9PEZI|nr:Siderophore iron transporter mirB 4 [Colletotrichum chlorophyti]
MSTPIEPQMARNGAGADIEKSQAFDNGATEVNNQKANESGDESDDYQGGIQRVRAITAVWDKKTMVIMFCLLYLVSFADGLLQSVQGNLNAFVTSSFHKHGLLSIVSIFANMLSGCCQLPIAKIIDIWGRSEGFLVLLLCSAVGMILKATCQNMETYVAGHTIYYLGHFGMLFVISVMVADMTTLKNRMLILGILRTPTVIVVFAGSKIADLFYQNLNFRWAFGAFAIILVGVSVPALVVMLIMQRKAEKAGFLQKVKSDRTYLQGFIYYLVQFDVVAIILIIGMFVMIMLPFSIVPYSPNGWKTPYIIAMEVTGVVLIPLVYIWERNFAKVQFIPYKYLKERTLVGSCLLYGIMFASIFTWDTYYQSYLMVVHRQDITTAGYILNSFSLASAFFGPLFGLIIKWTGDYKYTALAGVPFFVLGTALLVPYRTPDTPVGALVVFQLMNGIGTGLFAACGQIAIWSVVTHQEVAVVNAIWGLFGGIGSTVGYTIAGGLWNNVLPAQLYNRLPEDAKNRTMEIFGDVIIQMSFADGDPIRDAIVGAYADVQHKMVIAGACLVPPCLACILLWKRVNIKKLEEERGVQTKGNVY